MIVRFFQRLAMSAVFIASIHQSVQASSVARVWNETQLACIRLSLARPTVHALHLKRMGIAMYDAWAAYDEIARPYMLGQTHGAFTCPYEGIPAVSAENINSYRDEAISYAAYTYLKNNYPPQAIGPNPEIINELLDSVMTSLGYNINYWSVNYQNGNPANLGIFIAQQLDEWSFVDGTNEQNSYSNQIYDTENMEMNPNFPGNPGAIYPNQWQSLDLAVCTDQAGNNIPCGANATIPALSHDWGWVHPFSLDSCQRSYHERNGVDWSIYLDPGEPPYLESTEYLPSEMLGPNVNMFKYGFLTTLMWHWFHNNPNAGMIDTSPNNIGNLNYVLNPTLPGEQGPEDLPASITEYAAFYNLFTGQVPDPGYDENPITGTAYAEQIVPMGDYSRAIAQYWADGPKSETPPGHWFVILNEVADALPERRWRGGNNPIISDLEWDVKSYFTLGGGVHDAAVACWSAKGAYDYTRPIYAIRTMAEFGQCTYPDSVNFDVNGLPLIEGYIELVTQEDVDNPNLHFDQQDLHEVKIKTWLGPYGFAPTDSTWQGTQEDGYGWKMALDWWTYQVASFVTPPFAGYYSGHSTYSRTAAEILTQITGDPFFPGGMFEYVVDTLFADTLHYPTAPVHLQWATYRDAADQCSISRIFGGLHPPQDDIPGRQVGLIIGNQVVDYAERFMFANPPYVVSVGVNEVNPASDAFDFSLTVQFDQSMNTATNPAIAATNPAVEALLTQGNSYWASDSLFIAEYTTAEGTGSLLGVSFSIENFEAANLMVVGTCSLDTLNFALNYVPQPFDIDLKAPTCIAIAQEPFLTDANVGNTWMVELTFDEPVDTSSFSFTGAINNADFTANFSYLNASWIDEQHAFVNYEMLDNNNELLLPLSAFYDGTDLAGNGVQGCELSASVAIDTNNPIAGIQTPQPDAIVSDSEAISGSFSIPVYFDDSMDTTEVPIITFLSDDPTINTLTLDSIIWLDNYNCIVYFSVVDSNIELDNIVMQISGATDSNGNPMNEPSVINEPFAVDTRNPLISSFTTSTDFITASPSSMSVTVSYDEEMNTAIAPLITMPEASELIPSSATWTDLTFTQTFSLSANNFNLFGIDVLVEGTATDAAGNLSYDSTLVDELDIQLVGIHDNDTYSWTMYPNPTQAGSLLTISTASSPIEKLEVIDVLGKVIYVSDNLKQSSYVLAIPAWSSGCYYVRLSTSNGIATRPLIISEYR